MTQVTAVPCSSALSATSLPGLDYSLNPYRGCSHDCAYCYAPCILRLPRQTWGTHVAAKTTIAEVLGREVRRKKPGVVGLSTVTDPYQPAEREWTLTRQCLRRFVDTSFSAHIQTKSALVTRDLDVLRRLPNAQVMVTVTTLRDEERRLLEPGASSIQERLDALSACADAGVPTAAFLGPLYPTTTLTDVTALFEALRARDVAEVWVDKLNDKPGIGGELAGRLRTLPAASLAFADALKGASWYVPLRHECHRLGASHGIRVLDAF